MARHARRGFTLVELIIVILIIGVLAAIATPNFHGGGRPRVDSPRHCRARLRTLDGAFEMYVLDQNLKPPLPRFDAELIQKLIKGGYLQSDPTLERYTGKCRYPGAEGWATCETHGTAQDIDRGVEVVLAQQRRRDLDVPLTIVGLGALGIFCVWVFKWLLREADAGANPWPFSSAPRMACQTGKSRPVAPVIRFLGEPLQVREGARCPICATGLSGQALACAACDTAHHAECFNYNGSCGLYGCGSKHVNAAVC